METIVTVLAVLVIAAPLVVLALRTTRWDPLDRSAVRPPDGHDADDRRATLDAAALSAHAVPEPPEPALVERRPELDLTRVAAHR
jgi:hypothetical protein